MRLGFGNDAGRPFATGRCAGKVAPDKDVADNRPGVGFGAVILVGMLLVQGISMWIAEKNTREFLGANAKFAVLSMVRETRRRLAPVRGLNEYITRMIDSSQVDINDHEQFG
jgi:hypothetical protein